MRASLRKTLAAALTLGAAVIAFPVEALVCKVLPYDENIPVEHVAKAAAEYARKRIAEMQSIFHGRVVSAEYVPFQRHGGAYIITYEVSHWYKGRGGPHAKVVQYDQCEDACSIEETIRSMEASQDSAVVFIEAFKARLPFARQVRGPIDGEIQACKSVYLRQTSNERLPEHTAPEFGDVVFRNELRAWLRTR